MDEEISGMFPAPSFMSRRIKLALKAKGGSTFYYQNGPNKVTSEYMSDTILVLLTEYWVIPSQINTGLLLHHL